jgi:hypothetical protein
MAGYLVFIVIPLGAVDSVTERNLRTEESARQSFVEGVARRNNDVAARPYFLKAAFEYDFLRRCRCINFYPEVCLNEGNSNVLAGHIPNAIIAYCRGLNLDPDRADLRQGLAYARSRVDFAGDERAKLTPRPESFGWLRGPLRRFGLFALAATSAIGWFSLTRWRMTRSRSALFVAAGFLTVAVALAAGRLLDAEARRQAAHEPLAITTREVVLRQGDGPSFAPRRDSPLPAGVELTVRIDRGRWVQVELADGTLGWLPTDSIEKSVE